MAGRKKRKQNIPVGGILIFLTLIAILAVIFLIIGNGRIYKSSSANRQEISRTAETLKNLESKSPTAFKANQPAVISDVQTEREKALAVTMDSYDIDQGRRWFQGTVILGDSLMVAAEEYGFLGNDVVVGEIGVGLENSDDLFAQTIDRQPSAVFLCFGMNDMSNYIGNVDMFIAKYAERIQQLKAALPNSVFYINSVFPIQPGYESTVEGAEYQKQYNEALKAYCEKTEDVHYMDTAFILESDPDLYDADGIHPVAQFYPKWLTFVAGFAGLSEAEEEGQSQV